MSQSPLRSHSASPADLRERIGADNRGRPYLLLRDADGAQRLFELDDSVDRATLGRSPDSALAIVWDHEVSRHHAMVERSADGWSLVDDGRSLNGTYVNEERIRGRRRLRDGDVFRIGETAIAFRDPARRPSMPTLPSLRAPEPVRISDAQRRVLVALCRPFAETRAVPTPPSNEELAAELHLSVDAVKTHLRTLFGRFALDDLPRAQKRLRLIERALETATVTSADYDG